MYICFQKEAMIPYLLFPRFFKWFGLGLVIAGFVTGALMQPNVDDLSDGTGLLVQVMILAGLLFISCAREKFEDEFIKYYRLVSLQWAVLLLIVLRVSYKVIAWYTADAGWTPHFQVNALLIFYLAFFYYQLYLKDRLMNVFGKRDEQ